MEKNEKTKKKNKIRALVLVSGGLDSALAIKILNEQEIETTAIVFKSFFFNEKRAESVAKELNVNFKIVDFSEEHLAMVKNPKRGYGKAMNPCIDCHLLMLKKAKEIMDREGFDFVATGDVLGQRPMSQNIASLNLIEKEAGLAGYLLRPLSAKVLEKTIVEEKGLIDREKLLGISGRSRNVQLALAKKWNIKNYSSPAGGCLLTDKEFGKRLEELVEKEPGCDGNDVELLKLGRHLFQNKIKIIIGRDQEENRKMGKLAQKGDIVLEMENYTGPLALVRNYGEEEEGGLEKAIGKAKELVQFYSTRARAKTDVKFKKTCLRHRHLSV